MAVLFALLGSAAPAFAGGGPQLLLPLVAALSLGSSAAHYATGGGPSAGPGLVARLLPARLQVPTMQVEPVKARHVSSYVSGVDTDLLVGIDLLGHPLAGWMVAVHVDDESRVPLAGSSNAVSVIAEFRF